MRVIVVGGGIGGLAATVGLRRAGHDVAVFERAPRIEPAGAGITLFANAMRALERLGVREAVAEQGTPAKRSAILTPAGRTLTEVPSDMLEGTVALHRADLQAVLAEAAGKVRLGVEITAVEQDADGVMARGADGTEEHGDLLVGADGLNSVVRRMLIDVRPRYAGYTAWRGVSRVAVDSGRLSEAWGVGERFGLVDIGRGRTYWFATKNAPEGEPDEPGGRKAEIRRRFSDWHEPIAAVVEAANEGAVLRNDVYYLDPLPRWSEAVSSCLATRRTRRPPVSARARPRHSKMPSCSPKRLLRAASCGARSPPTSRFAARGRGRAEDFPSRRQGRTARESPRPAAEERRRPRDARVGPASSARAARARRGVA
jgi:2-polyprenyl-6-methoxyphenol hydroxylase-like FAD-dependent oxidoreductase